METKDFKFNFIDSIERVLRFYIPGVFLIAILKIYFSAFYDNILIILNKSGIGIYLLTPIIGIIIYSFHKSLFMIPEYILYKLNKTAISLNELKRNTDDNFPILLGRYINLRHEKRPKNEATKYLHYRTAMTHLLLILSELIIVSSFLTRNDTFSEGSFISKYYFCFLILSIILFVGSFIKMCVLFLAEKSMFDENES